MCMHKHGVVVKKYSMHAHTNCSYVLPHALLLKMLNSTSTVYSKVQVGVVMYILELVSCSVAGNVLYIMVS